MEDEEYLEDGKVYKKGPERDYNKAKLLGKLWTQYHMARVQGYDEIAERARKKIDRLKKEIEEE